MNRMRAARLVGAVLVATGAAITVSVPATAQPTTGSSTNTSLAPQVLAALQRDLGLTSEQVTARLTSEARATEAEQLLRGTLGGLFGGAWYDAGLGRLVVGVTDPAKADQVRAAGAEPTVVRHSLSRLSDAKAALDRAGAPKSVTGWYVDAASNSVVVKVNRNTRDAATDTFLATARTLTDAVRVVEVDQAPRLLADLRGGDAWYIGTSGRCSVGFNAVGADGGEYFVTAGHCTEGGGTAYGPDQRTPLGAISESTFGAGGDYGKVDVTATGWNLLGEVSGYDSADVTVAGSTEAPVGASICRSGSTTGWHCGTVESKDETVQYAEGAVEGLTQTDVCAEPGDSGGSWISDDQAQGVTSGGSGDCTSGGTTYFQPINEALSAYDLELVTG
ncbi:S1 family peptidase [Goodfellowiella coeruleoviolacea]|uniref:Streptogrisin C n=1 Tax=Goodfellowiella coeruleoviolacea TaxID=334858 RepID=A0AAE3KE18_9PSEU|nr:S1 family peptidase [Goodfellowiella coeruleoviolacea]MCP2164796.1 streptogrisin C [Goodfellowiella coeruleoviolacea]